MYRGLRIFIKTKYKLLMDFEKIQLNNKINEIIQNAFIDFKLKHGEFFKDQLKIAQNTIKDTQDMQWSNNLDRNIINDSLISETNCSEKKINFFIIVIFLLYILYY